MPKAMKRMKLEEKKGSSVGWNDLPSELIRHILSFMTFDEIAQLRPVCRSLNEHGKYVLHRGAQLVLAAVCFSRVYNYEDYKKWCGEEPKIVNKEWHLIIGDLCRLFHIYETYMDNADMPSSGFVAGKFLDCILEKLLLHHEDLSCCARMELYNLTNRAYYHFRGVIIPMIRKRSLRPRLAPTASTATTTGTSSTTHQAGEEAEKKKRPIENQGPAVFKKPKVVVCPCTFADIEEDDIDEALPDEHLH